MIKINVTLPGAVFALIASGKKKWVAHKSNPRINRYFSSKTPTHAKINGVVFSIRRIQQMADSWKVFI